MIEQLGPTGRMTVQVHYVFQVDPERIACLPRMEELHATQYHPQFQRTNDYRAVTCPACKRTDIYKRVSGT